MLPLEAWDRLLANLGWRWITLLKPMLSWPTVQLLRLPRPRILIYFLPFEVLVPALGSLQSLELEPSRSLAQQFSINSLLILEIPLPEPICSRTIRVSFPTRS